MPGRPDALFLQSAPKVSGSITVRVRETCKILERLLECDYPREKVWIRKQPFGRLFITRDPADTVLFPTGHPRSGQPRYRWERALDGTELGYLLEDADA
jgi:hypothetical protein